LALGQEVKAGSGLFVRRYPVANGQGETIEETKENLRQAIELILEDRRAEILC
jgi:predicted RNase H-like HicB family nuclease